MKIEIVVVASNFKNLLFFNDALSKVVTIAFFN